MDNVCIVIQGPTEFCTEVSLTYGAYPNVIWSTWTTEPEKSKNFIRECGITLVESVIPANSGKGNINMQNLSTKAGLDKAAEMGFEYVLKLRHDLFFEYRGPGDRYKWMEIFSQNGNISFLCSHRSERGEDYLVDYFNFGPLRKMIDFWSFYGTEYDMCAELQMKRWFKKVLPKGEKVNFVLPCFGNSVNAFWKRRDGIMLSEYKKYPEVGYVQPWSG